MTTKLDPNQVETDKPLVQFSGSYARFCKSLCLLVRGYEKNYPPEEDPWWCGQEADHEVNFLIDALNLMAPAGYHFGPHDNWNDQWGFWKMQP